MTQRSYSLLSKIFMVWLVALSLLMVGFAHRPALSTDKIAQTEYLASMGLTSADLCGTPGQDGSSAADDCPVCHIAAGMLLPAPMDSVSNIELRVAAALLIPAQTRSFGRSRNPATPVRAPPLA